MLLLNGTHGQRWLAWWLQLVLHSIRFGWQWFVQFSQFLLPVSEGTMVAVLAFTFCLEELANLGLVVAVWYVHHLQHQLIGQGIFSRSQLVRTMSEMAIVAFDAATGAHQEMLAELSFVKIS